MSEYDQHNEERREERRNEPRPEAKAHVARYSPWLWVIPAIAVFFVGYLVVRYGLFGGGDITVRFSEARGLDRYSPVRFRGAKVGTVEKITIDKDLSSVVVRISMDASMNHALKKGTRFWIVEPGLESGGIGGLLSGTYVGIEPGPGDDTREFNGQEYAPIQSAPVAGKTVILEAQGLGSVGAGTPIQFQGIRVGRILGSEYNDATRTTLIHAFIVQRFAHSVRQSTRFWRGGGLNVSLSGAGVSLGGGGLNGLLNSPVSFRTPEVLAGPEVANGTHFELYESESAAMAASDGAQLAYVTYFAGPVHGLQPGTTVTMKGVEVGRVRDVRLRYVPASGSLQTPVVFEIDPRKLEIPVTDATSRDELRATMDNVMQTLVQKGMRATLSTSLVLPGASGIALDIVARPGTARLVVNNDPPIVPAASGGGGIEGALSSLNQIAGRINNLPIEEIAGHLSSTAARLDQFVHDPALAESLTNVRTATASAERAAKSIETTAATASQSVAPIVASLRNASAAAEQAAARAQQLIGTSQHQNFDLGQLIQELTRAAEAVRSLASYLEENPDSLLKGRGK